MKIWYIATILAMAAAIGFVVWKTNQAPVPTVKEEAATKDPAKEPPCKDLSLKLMKCEPYTCSVPHPVIKNFTLKHTVVGRAENGLCVHMQTAPRNMLIVCHYSDEMKLLVAKNLQVPTPEPLTPDEKNVMSAGFETECEVTDQKTGEKDRVQVGCMKIYHNPRCTKSRLTLQLLQEKGYNPEIVEYLKAGFTAKEVEEVLSLLKLEPREFIRKGDAEYKESGADNPALSRAALITKIVEYPILFERPVVIHEDKAAIGRPPEKVLELLE